MKLHGQGSTDTYMYIGIQIDLGPSFRKWAFIVNSNPGTATCKSSRHIHVHNNAEQQWNNDFTVCFIFACIVC